MEKKSLLLVLAFGEGKDDSFTPNAMMKKFISLKAEEEIVFTDIEKPSPTPVTILKLLNYVSENNLISPDVYIFGARPYGFTHESRIYSDLLKLAKKEKVGLGTIYLTYHTKKIPRSLWCDKSSTQPWTRNVFAWNFREIIVRLLRLFWYSKYLSQSKIVTDHHSKWGTN